ncbi:MAG: glycoside hydrolase [Prolixibacteraceae bacterium]|nr:glycoside hydrolase [Prolixibacteraceae bacterium]
MKNLYAILILGFFLLSNSAHANKWGRVAGFEGLWNFSVGDDMKWAESAFDDSDWDKIFVPGYWDNYYSGYNGYAWYRKKFDVRSFPGEGPLMLMLGQIDDVDEVFINGVKVGQTGSFLPDFETAYNVERRYAIPDGLLKEKDNTIAIRVYDTAGPGGILQAEMLGIFFDNDVNLLSLDLSGKWKFSVFREKGISNVGFNDSDWAEINVPGTWESQGYDAYDGYAWYRKKFILPVELENQDLYLVLGRVDDYDKVYLNGELVGRTEYLDHYNRVDKWRAYQLYRVYKIPATNFRKFNELVVEVYDEQLDGGIYEGPIGLMTYNDAKILIERNVFDFWDNPIRGLMRIFDIY